MRGIQLVCARSEAEFCGNESELRRIPFVDHFIQLTSSCHCSLPGSKPASLDSFVANILWDTTALIAVLQFMYPDTSVF